MRKISFILVSSLLVLLVAGCRDKEKQTAHTTDIPATTGTVMPREGDSIEVFVVDTLSGDTDTVVIHHEEKLIELPVDREEKAKAKAESKQPKKKADKTAKAKTTGQQSADAKVFDVKGPVRSINYTQGLFGSYNQVVYMREQRDIIELTSDGKWKSSGLYTIKRDARGQLKSITRNSDKVTNEFSWSGSTLQSVKVYSQTKKNISCTSRLRRNAKGVILGYTATIQMPGCDGQENVSVKVLESDQYGNWTRRRFRSNQQSYVEERTIEYYK